MSISRGDEGERDAGPGIFDPELAEISLDVQELAGNSVQQQTENGIMSADAAVEKITQSISAAQRDLFIARRSRQPDTTLQAQLVAKLGQQRELLSVAGELLEIKRLFVNADDPQDIIDAGARLPPVQSRLNQILSQIPDTAIVAVATGDQKQDTTTELRNTTLHISGMSTLLREMQGEARRLANQEASTTPQRRTELETKSRDIDAEVLRLGDSRTAIAAALSALERAATPTEITTAVRNAITEMAATQAEISRANALMAAIVPLLKPE